MNKAQRVLGVVETHGRGRKFGDPGTEGPVTLSDEESFGVIYGIIAGIDTDELDIQGSQFVARKIMDQLNQMKVKLVRG